VLPAPGRWSLTARLRGRGYPLGAVLATPPPAEVVEPFSVALAPDGTLVVADREGDRVVRIEPASGRSTVLAELNEPIEVAVETDGDVLVIAEQRIRLIAAGSGTVTTVAGTGERTFGPDGVPAAGAPLSGPTGLALAPDGDVLIAEYDNRVRRIDAQSGLITTLIGDGTEGSGGDGGPARAARVAAPHGVAVARDGSVLVADSHNGRVRRIGPDGVVQTIPGGPTVPIEVVVSSDGSLYVVGDNRIWRDGRPVAGNGAEVSAGDGGPAARASLNVPNSVAVAADGTLYIGEFGGRRVRRVDGRTGVITTVAR
jgi:sugar lactone lactonase YvrE